MAMRAGAALGHFLLRVMIGGHAEYAIACWELSLPQRMTVWRVAHSSSMPEDILALQMTMAAVQHLDGWAQHLCEVASSMGRHVFDIEAMEVDAYEKSLIEMKRTAPIGDARKQFNALAPRTGNELSDESDDGLAGALLLGTRRRTAVQNGNGGDADNEDDADVDLEDWFSCSRNETC